MLGCPLLCKNPRGSIVYAFNQSSYSLRFAVTASDKVRDEDLMFCEKMAIHKARKELIEHHTKTITACMCMKYERERR